MSRGASQRVAVDRLVRAPRWSWALAIVLVVVGVAAVLSRPTAPALPPPGPAAAAATTFSPATLAAVDAWTGPVRTARLLSMGAHVLVPLLLVGTARGRGLLRALGGRRGGAWRGAAVVVLATAVVVAPLRWWIGWHHAGEFGFRTSSATRFVVEAVGEVALEAVLTATAVGMLLWLVRHRPRDWPAVGTLAGTALAALLVLAAPVVVTELLLAPEPLDDPEVEAVVRPVLAASTVTTQALEVGQASVRTTRVNALVTGIGPTRRVVLYDTLLEREPRRVASVVAHELAHAEHDDVERGVLASSIGILAGLLVLRAGGRALVARGLRPRGAVLGAGVAGAVVVLQLVAAPVVAWESRRVEAAADHRALELTGDPAAAVAVQRGFVVEDLADPTPPTWVELLRSHPTPHDRIEAAVAFAQRHDVGLAGGPSARPGSGGVP